MVVVGVVCVYWGVRGGGCCISHSGDGGGGENGGRERGNICYSGGSGGSKCSDDENVSNGLVESDISCDSGDNGDDCVSLVLQSVSRVKDSKTDINKKKTDILTDKP